MEANTRKRIYLKEEKKTNLNYQVMKSGEKKKQIYQHLAVARPPMSVLDREFIRNSNESESAARYMFINRKRNRLYMQQHTTTLVYRIE